MTRSPLDGPKMRSLSEAEHTFWFFFFRRRRLFLRSDNPQRQKMWEGTLSIRAGSKACREAVFRERRVQTPGAAASVFRALLSIEYHIGRELAITETRQSVMSPWQRHSLRIGQLSVEANLVRAGFPPSCICEIQNQMLEHLAELCQPLNAAAYFRSVGKDLWIKGQGGLTEAELRDALNRKFSADLDQDRRGKLPANLPNVWLVRHACMFPLMWLFANLEQSGQAWSAPSLRAAARGCIHR